MLITTADQLKWKLTNVDSTTPDKSNATIYKNCQSYTTNWPIIVNSTTPFVTTTPQSTTTMGITTTTVGNQNTRTTIGTTTGNVSSQLQQTPQLPQQVLPPPQLPLRPQLYSRLSQQQQQQQPSHRIQSRRQLELVQMATGGKLVTLMTRRWLKGNLLVISTTSIHVTSLAA
ncbi:unnamed protein product, partial [Mesorhabditis belari]|uniref:Uncharacterized protein n=1 Tax=Mesorhabditis belari TaxID=2138241 RepID=A0AAF3EK43_9BILA